MRNTWIPIVMLLGSALQLPAFTETAVPGATPAAMQATAVNPPTTVTGRIVRLDTKGRTFSVRGGETGRTVELKAGNVNVNYLRRGERVTVTYSGGVALKIEATRDLK